MYKLLFSNQADPLTIKEIKKLRDNKLVNQEEVDNPNYELVSAKISIFKEEKDYKDNTLGLYLFLDIGEVVDSYFSANKSKEGNDSFNTFLKYLKNNEQITVYKKDAMVEALLL